MTESIKFGPEWLRNSLSKQEETVSRPIMSDYRYSCEEMLGIIDEKNSRKTPEILPAYKRLHINQFQTPLALIQIDEERPTSGHTRTFLNSNIKHGFVNWRKNLKEPQEENWRYPSNKENKESFYSSLESKFGEKLKKNWRDKPSVDDQMLSVYSPKVHGHEIKPTEREEISPSKLIIKPQNIVERIETTEEKQNQYVLSITSDKTAMNLFDNNSKIREIKKIENPNIQTDSNICELNLKKLENDLLMDLQELSLDEEKKMITWFYVDPLGKIQGPFKEEEMSLWYQHGFFYDTLMLRRSIDSSFISLHHLIQAFGTAQPFVIASTGFPIPKVDHVDNLPYKSPPKMPVMNQPNQFEAAAAAAMYRGQNLVQQYPNGMQFQNNMPQPQQHINPNYKQFIPNQQLQQNVPQIDPRLINMNGGHPYIQNFNNMNNNPNFNNMNINQTRFPPQLPPQMINQMPQQMKNQFQAPIINQYPQSMIHQMPSIIPSNPIQKLLFELQKQKEIEQQRAMYLQHTQNVAAAQSMNEQIMQQNKMESNRQNKIQQPYFNNISNPPMQNKYDHNSNLTMQNNNMHSNNNNPIVQQPIRPIEPPQEPANFDADDEGEFRLVGNLKKKKFQKENNKEKAEKVKDIIPQLSRSATKLTDSKLVMAPNKNDTKLVINEVNAVKSNNDISQIIINQLSKVEEKSKLPAMPAPWIDKVAVNLTESENLKRIQIEEEEIRQIEMQVKREKELEQMKKEQEMKQKIHQMKWNVVVTENLDELTSFKSIAEEPIWDSAKVSKNVKKVSRPQAIARSKPKEPADANNNVDSNSNDMQKNLFKKWCVDMLSKMNTTIDIPVFVNFLYDLESPYEIEDYVKMYLGETIESHLFTKKFLERRSLYRKAMKKVEIDDDLCAPPRAINPGTYSEEQYKTQNKKKTDKKIKKAMKVADANILGFKGTAASNRIVGELHEDEF